MPIPVCRDAQKGKQVEGAAGRTRGVPRTARASSKPCNRSDGAETETGTEREAPNRFGSTSSSPREMPSFFSSSPFYSPSRGRLALTTYQPNLPTSDPRMYLLRPCMLLGARVCEEPVPTPWCSIPLSDGFLHNIRPHLTAHPPVCAKIGFLLEKNRSLLLLLVYRFVLCLGLLAVAAHAS